MNATLDQSQNGSPKFLVDHAGIEQQVHAFLSTPGAYADPTDRVEFRETHISRVYLTERFAYKVKKPVRFDFLDFSTPELRRQACEDELRLNRRLAPEVYRSVTPIRRENNGELKLGGRRGDVVDWVVVMRRLQDKHRLDQRLRRGEIRPAEVEAIADRIAHFHAGQAPVMIRSSQYIDRVRNHVVDNERALLEQGPPRWRSMIQRIHSAQRRFIRVFADDLSDRVCDGCIVDGHGDLRPEHVYLDDPPLIIDCVEFSAELRCNDVLDDLAFLLMECERLEADRLSQRIWSRYRETTGESADDRLVAFYKCYRACVRAKVAALRAAQTSSGGANREPGADCLQLAARYARLLGAPLMIVVGGAMGTGKSTLARELADVCSAPLLQTDALRRPSSGGQEAYGVGDYAADARDAVYGRMFARAEELLHDHVTVVLDGSFSQQRWREQAVDLARRRSALVWQVQCTCPPETARQRIAARRAEGRDASEARPELLAHQLKELEPPLDYVPTRIVPTHVAREGELQDWVRQVLKI